MKIADVEISSPYMNGACSVAKTVDDVQALCNTKVGVVLVGSITVEAREGNAEPRWFVGDGYALNSFGMPNGGIPFYKSKLPEMAEMAHKSGKKLALSVAGFSTAEYVELAELAANSSVDLLELNFGCPNVSVDGKQKPIVSFDTTTMQEIIRSVAGVTTIPLMIKLSPYSNPAQLKEVAQVLATTDLVTAVVTSNTFPNGYESKDEAPVLASTYGGVSGSAMRAIAVGQVKQFRDALPDRIAVIGVGGIESIDNARQFFAAGASMVQCATLIVRDGHAAIDRVIQ